MLLMTVFSGCNKVKVPTLNTTQPSNVSTTSCLAGGIVTDNGGDEVTERGVCWGTDTKPTITNDHLASNNSGVGSFSCQITGLSAGTTYYVRAYAVNSAGTGYGEALSFITLTDNGGDDNGDDNGDDDTVTVPVLITGEASEITDNAARCGGMVTSEGGSAVFERGVCWSTVENPTIANSHVAASAAGLGAFSCNITGLTGGVTYFYRAYATNEKGTGYGEQKSFKTLSVPVFPEGSISSSFSVSETEQVCFSKGNLQYQASARQWRFAEHQWDYVGSKSMGCDGTVQGSDNAYVSATYSGWIDLFGWGTSGWDSGNTYFYPWDTIFYNPDMTYSSSYYGPLGEYDLTGQYAYCDWGHNRISNGGNKPDMWRTLSRDEWNYILYDRNTDSGIHFALAKVNGVKGAILFPDDWSPNYYMPHNPDDYEAYFASNIVSASDWAILERYGAVFIPVPGRRAGSDVVYCGSYGEYWTATCFGRTAAFVIAFENTIINDGTFGGSFNMRNYGAAVRLVYNLEK